MTKLKILLPLTLILFLLLVSASQSVASLLQLEPVTGEFVVHDSVNNTQWVADLTLFTNMTYSQQMAKISEMDNNTYAGVAGWHLATLAELTNLFAQVSSLADAQQFIPTVDLAPTYFEWIGRLEVAVAPSYHQVGYIRYDNAYFQKNVKMPAFLPADTGYFDSLGAWVVTNSAPVPEPATMLLLASGLVGLAGLKRKIKKS